MSHVILAGTSTDLSRRLRLATEDNLTVIRPDQVPATPGQLRAMLDDGVDISVLVLDVTDGQVPLDHALLLARQAGQQAAPMAIVLVSDQPEQIALTALRAGVGDVLPVESSVEDIRVAVRGIGASARGRINGAQTSLDLTTGRVITVASPKGGVGKTTVATNIAVALADKSPQGTVIVDLDVQFGDVAAALDLDPTYTLGDLATTAVPDLIGLKALLTPHPSGLQVVAGVRSPAEADRIDPVLVGQLLDILRREFRYVVVDSAPGMSEETLSALDHTTDLVLVTTLDVPGLRGLRKELDLLNDLALPPHTRHVVINMYDRAGGLTIADAEATLGQKADVVLTRSLKVARSTNHGTPIVRLHPREKVSQEIQSLVSRFAPITSRRERRGLLLDGVRRS